MKYIHFIILVICSSLFSCKRTDDGIGTISLFKVRNSTNHHIIINLYDRTANDSIRFDLLNVNDSVEVGKTITIMPSTSPSSTLFLDKYDSAIIVFDTTRSISYSVSRSDISIYSAGKNILRRGNYAEQSLEIVNNYNFRKLLYVIDEDDYLVAQKIK